MIDIVERLRRFADLDEGISFGAEAVIRDAAAEIERLREGALPSLFKAWYDTHGAPLPWRKAVEMTAIVMRLPAEERERLIALDDDARKP